MDKIYLIGSDAVPQRIDLGAGESLEAVFVVLPGVSCSLDLEISLNAPGARADIAGLFLCKGGESVDIRVNMRHNASDCTSDQMFKGIAGGDARVSFDGLVYVARDAQRTKSHQQCHSILLSSEAVCETRPQLEIYADDVECSHGATSGYLDADERFYMQSRGIPEEEARTLQIISFLSAVASRLPEELKQKVYDSIS